MFQTEKGQNSKRKYVRLHPFLSNVSGYFTAAYWKVVDNFLTSSENIFLLNYVFHIALFVCSAEVNSMQNNRILSTFKLQVKVLFSFSICTGYGLLLFQSKNSNFKNSQTGCRSCYVQRKISSPNNITAIEHEGYPAIIRLR